jgi:hypothetical protein
MIKQARNVAIVVVLAFVSSAVSTPNDSLSRFLPADDEIGGWKTQKQIQHYAGEDLYEYIDGGAEIYHEYGFRQVVVQDYVNAAGISVSIEIFEMTTPESAYGMYTFKTNAQGKRIPLGDDAELADYYLNFWKGTFLVTMTGFDETLETVGGLLAIARKVESKIKTEGKGEKPLIASLLPPKGLESRSLKYVKGLLGLRSSHPFFDLEITGFEEGIKGNYADGYSLFLIRFEGEGECRKSFDRLMQEYAQIPGYEELGDFGAFLARDKRERNFFVSSLGSYLLIGIGDIDPSKAEMILETIKEKMMGTSHQVPPYFIESHSPSK